VTFVIHLSALSAIGYFFLVVACFAAIFEIWALVDTLTRPAQAFVAAHKLSKPLWLVINGTATVVGVGYAFYVGSVAVLSFFPVVAFVATAVYITDVKPKVKDFKSHGGSNTHMGPYGPW
jgi:predicted histidine transporter YuiF (NhaC family)